MKTTKQNKKLRKTFKNQRETNMKNFYTLFLALFFVFLGQHVSFAQQTLALEKPNNGWSTARLIPIAGQTLSSVKWVQIVYNGIPFRLAVQNGKFSREFVASPGLNQIYAEVEINGNVYKDSVSFYSKAPSKAMKIVLVWDTDLTDVDLWITEPSGEKCYYGYRNTKSGGSLDVDVVNGYGPEVYTLASPVKGNYLIQVHYFSDNNQPQTNAKIYVVQYEGTSKENIKEYETMLTATGFEVKIDVVALD